MATALAPAPTPAPALPEVETCDGCGVRASVTTSFPLPGVRRRTSLSWCGHHFRRNEPELRSRYGDHLVVEDRRAWQ